MPASPSLGEIFLANAPDGIIVPEDRSRLERLLADAFETGRTPWPGVVLTPEQFVHHVAKRLPGSSRGKTLEEVLDSLHLPDLYLACACAHRVPQAVEALEREYVSKIPSILRRHRYAPEMVDDVCQKLREILFLESHISTYTGEGKLSSWVEVIAKRTANKESRRSGNESSGFSKIVEVIPGSGDLEKDILKQNLLAKFTAALKEVLASLTDEQREMLKFHLCDGLSEAKIAVLFNTSQPTVSRRLKSLREHIFEETKRLLREQLDLSEKDFQSFIGDLESRWFDVSLSKLLGGKDSGEDHEE